MGDGLIRSCTQINSSDCHHCRLQLHTVRSYILDGGSSDVAGNADKIFNPVESAIDHPSDKVVPVLSSSYFQEHLVR